MSNIIDLSALGSNGFVIHGDAGDDRAGVSVSSAGDFDGDGFDDILIGARGNDSGGDLAGAAYVVFGKSGGLGPIDLSALAAADGFRIQGDAAGDAAGQCVSSAGDIDGDGFDDLIVGAYRNDSGGFGAGAAYVLFGRPGRFGPIDLTSLLADDGFRILGDADNDRAGRSVSSAGDVNGDGFDDILIGAPFNDSGGSNAGAAYLLFGKSGGFSPIDLAALAPANGFKIQGDAAGDYAGFSVSSAGDVNGDGFGDLLIGAQGNDSGGGNAGAAYVVFGKPGGFGPIDLANVGPVDGFKIQGDADGDRAGVSVSSAGDFDGDGFDDILIGADFNDSGAANAGAAYLLFGKSGGFGPIDLATLAAADGFKIQSDAGSDVAGYSVSAAGDFNGDGYDDLLIGADRNDSGGLEAGAAYVLFGKSGRFGPIDLAALPAADGFKIQGDTDDDRAGISVSSAGDVDGDGFGDLLIGAPYNDRGGFGAGAAYVLFGQGPAESVTRIGSGAGQTIRGGVGDDLLDGREGGDHLFGAGGDDKLIGGAGIDGLAGGLGDDLYVLADINQASQFAGSTYDKVAEAVGEGIDTILVEALDDPVTLSNRENYDLTANVENGRITGALHFNLRGNGLDNILTGNDGANLLDGGDGADRLSGGLGDDFLFGGAGDDLYILNDAFARSGAIVYDMVVEETQFGGAQLGTDTIRVGSEAFGPSGYTLDANIENGVVTGALAFGLTGNGLGNRLTGNSAANILDGGGGADVTIGGGGDDVHHVGGNADRVVERIGGGSDRVLALASYQLRAGVEVEWLATTDASATTALSLAGNAFANHITGNAGTNILRGHDGADRLLGLAGSDRLYGGDGGDAMFGGAGVDRFYFDTALDSAANVDRIGAFAAADDSILLDRAIFDGIAANRMLAVAAFRAGTAALDASDRIIHDSATGRIFYDADGAGGATQILFARIGAGIVLTRSDFATYSTAAAAVVAPPATVFEPLFRPTADALLSVPHAPFPGQHLGWGDAAIV